MLDLCEWRARLVPTRMKIYANAIDMTLQLNCNILITLYTKRKKYNIDVFSIQYQLVVKPVQVYYDLNSKMPHLNIQKLYQHNSAQLYSWKPW